MADDLKWCERCGENRPVAEFTKNAGAASGLQVYCRDHMNAYRREHSARTGKGKEWGRASRQRLREAMLNAYGRECACCGESEVMFLTLDHMDGFPETHRRADGKRLSSDKILGLLARESWPAGYQILCFNCNCAKGAFGECPHETARKAAA